MSRLGHQYCIRLFPDISTTDNATAATQKCKDVLNDTTAYNPKLHSKFEHRGLKLVLYGLRYPWINQFTVPNQIIILISPDWVINYLTKTMLKIDIPPRLPLSYYSIFREDKIYRCIIGV